MESATVTIFKDIFAKEPNYISVDAALERIKTGRSHDKIQQIREQIDKDRANNLKQTLPSICFSGKFIQREDAYLQKHSGYMVLDFDDVIELELKKKKLADLPFAKAVWVSPSGKGIKVLIRIADGAKHREHFAAIKDEFPEVDKSGVNESRVCYESSDPEIIIHDKCEPYKKLLEVKKMIAVEPVVDNTIFSNILKWLANRNDAFQKGERNLFTFKLASACCRFGMSEDECLSNFLRSYPTDTDFTDKEASKTIKSAYKANAQQFNTAQFDRERLIDVKTRKEVEISADIMDLSVKPKDVVYGEDVKWDALHLYRHGYEDLKGIGVPVIDEHFKMKRGEITLLSGIGNYGKSTFWFWTLLMRVLKYGEKFAFFSPENNPPHEFYHDFLEIYFGCQCTPNDFVNRPAEDIYSYMLDEISKHIFYVYPEEISPTPDYIKERFLELYIKEKIDGVVIDPFNQMMNDYKAAGGRSDKYLETVLADFTRFAQANQLYFTVVAHPKLLHKDGSGNYPCPDVFDIADGAMWNNKMDNILIYHRVNHQSDPTNPNCEFHTKKIRRQKSVGKKGIVEFEYHRMKRRFLFNGVDPMQALIDNFKSIS